MDLLLYFGIGDGAQGRTRTDISFPMADFESAASTIPPLGHGVPIPLSAAEVKTKSDFPSTSLRDKGAGIDGSDLCYTAFMLGP